MQCNGQSGGHHQDARPAGPRHGQQPAAQLRLELGAGARRPRHPLVHGRPAWERPARRPGRGRVRRQRDPDDVRDGRPEDLDHRPQPGRACCRVGRSASGRTRARWSTTTSASRQATTARPAPRSVCQIPCAAADWQQSDKSQFIAALNSYQETFPGISYTEVYSHIDEIVTPNSDDTGSSSVHGGGGAITNVAIQDVCPADPVRAPGDRHAGLRRLRPGHRCARRIPAPPTRRAPRRTIRPSALHLKLMPGIDPVTYPTDLAASAADLATNTASAPTVPAEPPLRCYVTASCPASGASVAGTQCQDKAKCKRKRKRGHRARRASAATARSAIGAASAHRHAARTLAATIAMHIARGRIGFDLVIRAIRLQVEVPGGLVKHLDQPISADHEFALAA